MIYIGIGSNLNGKNNETPLQNCKKALIELKKEVDICKISSWYKSEPTPVSNQPWYINGVVNKYKQISNRFIRTYFKYRRSLWKSKRKKK